MEAKCILSIKLLNFASATGIDYCSAFVPSFTDLNSLLVLNFDLKTFGSKCGAVFYEAFVKDLQKPMSTVFKTITSKNLLCSTGYFLTFTITGLLDSSRTTFNGLTLLDPLHRDWL